MLHCGGEAQVDGVLERASVTFLRKLGDLSRITRNQSLLVI
jgi:hypothetical protein